MSGGVQPPLVATYLPLEPTAADLVVPLEPVDTTISLHERRPPASLWSVTADYDEGVDRHVRSILDTLDALGAPTTDLGDILDFGCGTGRLLLGLHRELPETDRRLWGVDIHAARIEWARRNLSPTLRFATCSTFPHLPFEDRTFDLVVAGSVFTHIPDLADAWLLELLRVTAVDGLLYLTIQDQGWLETTLARPIDDWLTAFLAASPVDVHDLGQGTSMIVLDRGTPEAMVLHDRESLLDLWSSYAEVRAVVEHGYDAQTAVVLRKDPDHRPPSTRPPSPVLRFGPIVEAQELVGLPRVHGGATDDRRARAALAEHAPGAELQWLEVRDDGRIGTVSTGAADALGLDEAALVGATPETVQAMLGEQGEPVVLHADEDLLVHSLAYGDVTLVQANAAIRDEAGRAHSVLLLFAVTAEPGTGPTPQS